MKQKLLYVVLGILLIILFLNTQNINAESTDTELLDNIDVVFEKDYYAVDRGRSIGVTYKLTNNNDDQLDLYVYADCQEDIRCNYSENIKISGNGTTIERTIMVKGHDYGTEDLEFVVVKDNQKKEFTQKINIDRDNTRGDFTIEPKNRNLYIGKSNEVVLEIDNKYQSDIYKISFRTQTIDLKLKEPNPKYYNREEQDIYVSAFVDSETSLGSEKVEVRIESDDSLIIKEISFYFTEDLTEPIEFSVSRPSYESIVLYKEEPKTLTYNVTNLSNFKKNIYIAEFSDSEIDVTIENREIILDPKESKEVEVTFFSDLEVSSGNYDSNLSFFDGFDSILKKQRIILNPEYNISARMLQQNVSLKIGSVEEVTLLLQNYGDIAEDFDILASVGNDIQLELSTETIRVNPDKTAYVTVSLSAGSETQERTTDLLVRIIGHRSDFSETFEVKVNTFRERPSMPFTILSIPTELDLLPQREKDFEIILENFSDKDIYLERIEIRNLPANISYDLPTNILVSSLEQVTILGKIISEDIPKQEINAELVFISRDGGQLTRPLKISIVDVDLIEETPKKPTPLTGFFTLGHSALLGLILVCLIIVLLYATNVIKHKK